MSSDPHTAPRVQWRRRDDAGWNWSSAHTLTGPCPACPANTPAECPRCQGRLHRDPVADNGLSHTYLCQDERADREGRPQRTRSVRSAAQIRATLDREERERRAAWDRWTENAVTAWLVIGTTITLGGLLVALVSMVIYGR